MYNIFTIKISNTVNNTEFEIRKHPIEDLVSSFELCSCGVVYPKPVIIVKEESTELTSLVSTAVSEDRTLRASFNIGERLPPYLEFGLLNCDSNQVRHLLDKAVTRHCNKHGTERVNLQCQGV